MLSGVKLLSLVVTLPTMLVKSVVSARPPRNEYVPFVLLSVVVCVAVSSSDHLIVMLLALAPTALERKAILAKVASIQSLLPTGRIADSPLTNGGTVTVDTDTGR